MAYFRATARPIVEDLAGTLTFYLLYLATGSAALAAGIGLGLGIVQIAAHLLRGQRVPVILLLGVGLTVLLGGPSLLADSPRFLLLKPSIIYALIGLAMLPRGWLVRYVPVIARDLLPARTLDRAGWGWCALMLVSAVLNAVLVTALPPREAAAIFVTWGVATKLILFLAQYAVLRTSAVRRYRARQGGAP